MSGIFCLKPFPTAFSDDLAYTEKREVVSLTVYVDVLFITNLYITYVFIKAAQLLSHCKISRLRVIIASAVGGVASFSVFLTESLLLSLFIKLASLAAIGFILSGKKPRAFLAITSRLVIINLLFIGLCVLLWKLLGQTVYIIGATVYFDISLLTLMLTTAATYLLFWIYDFLSLRLNSKDGREVTVVTENSSVTLNGISDTGNTLYDFFTQKPVIVCSSDRLEKELGNLSCRLLAFTTVNGKGLIRVYSPKDVIIDGRSVNVSVGLMSDEKVYAVYNPCVLR